VLYRLQNLAVIQLTLSFKNALTGVPQVVVQWTASGNVPT